MSFRQDPFIRPVIRNIIREIIRPVFGFNPARAAAWILNLLSLGGTSTVTNGTASVYLNGDGIADGQTITSIPSGIGLIDGAAYNSTSETFDFDAADGTALALYTTKQTATGAVKTLTPMLSWSAGATVVAGQRMRVATTEGIHCHVQYVSGGTTDSAQPTVSTADIGAAAITDNDTTFLVLGHQTITGLFSGLAAIQYLANPAAPATQTTASLGTGVYTCWMDGTGSVAITAGTATLTGNGTATDGVPNTFTVTVAGTVTATVTGTPTRFQLEGGAVKTPFILTTPRSATVHTTPIAATKLTPTFGCGLIVARPSVAGQEVKFLLSSRLDASNFTAIQTLPTAVQLRKIVNTVESTAGVLYSHTAGTPFMCLYRWSSTSGVEITAASLAGTFPTPNPHVNTTPATLGVILETGSRDGVNQFSGTISTNATGNWNQMIDLAASMGMNVSNLIRE